MIGHQRLEILVAGHLLNSTKYPNLHVQEQNNMVCNLMTFAWKTKQKQKVDRWIDLVKTVYFSQQIC